ncbi:peptidoglycan bridge formation glycyltransferase FemA/FemB family protein [Candidatus Peregrinibacteria bacterium]|nr:peptidoglycan bridge formation glycyltransferase FemA/FemB family protein [Candidatus Peregrinibacteria bacterium]
MHYSIQEITDKKIWESFASNFPQRTFLHSWHWGEFNKNTDETIFRFGIYDDESSEVPSYTDGHCFNINDHGSHALHHISNTHHHVSHTNDNSSNTYHQNSNTNDINTKKYLKGIVLIIKVMARRGSFLFCPHGPLLDWNDESLVTAFFQFIQSLGKKEGVGFIRISPLLSNDEKHRNIFSRAGFRDAPIHMMHPELSWTLDITPSEASILQGMRKTTRYLVKKAEKDGVEIEVRKDEKAVSIFHEILRDTVTRQHFVPFSSEYLLGEFQSFLEDDHIALFLAKYEGRYIAGAVIVFYGNSAFYHHGASLAAFQKIPASYLVQWRAIQEAKRRNMSLYNFWGVVPEEQKNHPWWGLSLFKRGFGGSSMEYVHAQDFILKKTYWITYCIERLRRIKRRL